MKLKMCITQSVIALLALYVGLAQSWDVAVSFRDKLKFYTNETLISTIRLKFQSITALAYDDVCNRILYVDRQANGDAICGYSLSSVENRCFTERKRRKIHGIAFDSSTETIFFTETNDRTINTFSLKPGSQNNGTGNILIVINDGIPRDIVVDSCRRHVYWLTTDNPQPTIERARFNGTEREVFQIVNYLYINSTCHFWPNSLTIDPETKKLYWYEPWNTSEYRIYSSSVMEKKLKTTVYHAYLESNPVIVHPSNTLAVSNRLFYVVDFRNTGANVDIFGKEFAFGTGPETIVHDGFDIMTPVGIVANYQITEQDQNCEIF